MTQSLPRVNAIQEVFDTAQDFVMSADNTARDDSLVLKGYFGDGLVDNILTIDERCALEPLSDYGNARRMRIRFADELFYCEEGGWYAWDRHCWRGGNDVGMIYAHKQIEAFEGEIHAMRSSGKIPGESDQQSYKRIDALRAFAQKSGNLRETKAMVEQASTLMIHSSTDLDAHPFLINCENQLLEITKAGAKPRPADRKLLITKCVSTEYDKEAQCPQFSAFIADLFPRQELQDYVQKMLGYAITGSTEEQKLFIWYGKGANGKSTLVNVLRHVLGTYGKTLPFSSFVVSGRNAATEARPALAQLRARRLVVIGEADYSATLSAGLVKELSGGDLITGRQLYAKTFFEFVLQAKLVLSTNHFPKMTGFDHSVWRRISVIPFERTFSVQSDTGLFDGLKAEKSGILNWLLEGAVRWMNEGLDPPEEVQRLTMQYRASKNSAIAFFGDCMQPCEDADNIAISHAYSHYRQWCDTGGIEPIAIRKFARALRANGVESTKKSGLSVFTGVSMREGWNDL